MAIMEMPVFRKAGTKIESPEGPLKKMSIASTLENIVVFIEPNGNIFKPKGWIMAYFLDSPEAVQAFKRGEISYPMFMPGSVSMRMTGYSMIDAIWRKKSRKGATPTEKTADDNMKHIVGAVEAYMNIGVEPAGPKDEGAKTIYIDNISVRPGWRRNSVASKLIQAIEVTWPGIEITDHSGTTDAGFKFMKNTGRLKHNRSDGDHERTPDQVDKLA